MLAVLRLVGLALAVALAWQIFKYGTYGLALVLVLLAGEALFHAG